MARQKSWQADTKMDEILKQETLKHADTVQVIHGPVTHAGTATIAATIKSTDEVVQEMKTWLRTGMTPDGTRMMTDESWQWYQDFYQGTISDDPEHESLPAGALVDYYYWTCPYLAHIGEMKFVMMHAQVNFEDGTHMPADRLRSKTKQYKNLELLARKRAELEARAHEKFVARALEPGAHRGHPLRKEGIFTRYFWRPFLKQETYQKAPTKTVLGRGVTSAVEELLKEA